MSLKNLMKDDVYIVDFDGSRSGPYKTAFNNKEIVIPDGALVVSEGFKVLRPLPNGTEESFTVIGVSFQGNAGFRGIPQFYKLELRKDTAIRPASPHTTTNHINITGSQGIQIGDHNTQQFQLMFRDLVAQIDASKGSAEEKQEAKGRLAKFLAHPLVSTVVGASLGDALKLFGSD